MQLQYGNMFEAFNEADLWLFTANGVIKRNGALVMGAGIAKTVRDKWPGIDLKIGTPLIVTGKHITVL